MASIQELGHGCAGNYDAPPDPDRPELLPMHELIGRCARDPEHLGRFLHAHRERQLGRRIVPRSRGRLGCIASRRLNRKAERAAQSPTGLRPCAFQLAWLRTV